MAGPLRADGNCEKASPLALFSSDGTQIAPERSIFGASPFLCLLVEVVPQLWGKAARLTDGAEGMEDANVEPSGASAAQPRCYQAI